MTVRSVRQSAAGGDDGDADLKRLPTTASTTVSTAASMRRASFDQPVQPWQAELRAAGIAHRLNTGAPDAAAQVRLVQIALAHLLQGDCGRPVPIKNHTRYYTVTGQRGCLALRPGEPLRIEQVSGHAVATAGAAAYDAVVAACTGGQPALLGDADDQWPVPCNQPLPARPPRFELLAPS